MKDIILRIKPGERILLFLDYDGTLVPIKKTPELAVLHPLRRRFLERLGEDVFICIVSGRSLAEIRRLVGIKGIAYIGNHGLEISYGQKIWIHPEVKKSKPVLRKALKRIRERTQVLPGVIVEDKGLTGSIHYRQLSPAFWKPLKKIVRTEVESRRQELKLTEGKRVFEIRPNIQWDKGQGVLELIGWLDPRATILRIYIGDDQTDEDAFKVFDGDALTILVGHGENTFAHYHIKDVDVVWKFLSALLSAISLSIQKAATALNKQNNH